MHDRAGNLLQPGDQVVIPATVLAVHEAEEFCNLDVELLPMPGTEAPQRMSALNTRQVEKVVPLKAGGEKTTEQIANDVAHLTEVILAKLGQLRDRVGRGPAGREFELAITHAEDMGIRFGRALVRADTESAEGPYPPGEQAA